MIKDTLDFIQSVIKTTIQENADNLQDLPPLKEFLNIVIPTVEYKLKTLLAMSSQSLSVIFNDYDENKAELNFDIETKDIYEYKSFYDNNTYMIRSNATANFNWSYSINYNINKISYINVNHYALPIVDKDTFENADTDYISTIEDNIVEYIEENFDKYSISEYGSCIYDVIQSKAYDIAYDVFEKAKEDTVVIGIEDIVEVVIGKIDFDSMYEIVDDILNQPMTAEEILAEVGMSYRDFL